MDTGGWDGVFDEMDPGDTGWHDLGPGGELAHFAGPDDPLLDHHVDLAGADGDFAGVDPAHLGHHHEYDYGDLAADVADPPEPDDGFGLLGSDHHPDHDQLHDLVGEADQPMLDTQRPELPVAVPGSVVGTDPDLSQYHDDGQWLSSMFPPALELANPPVPVDGFPWADPGILGSFDPMGVPADPMGASVDPMGVAGAEGYGLPPGAWLTATPDELAAFDAGYHEAGPASGADWATLLSSDDPATSCLARWWATPA